MGLGLFDGWAMKDFDRPIIMLGPTRSGKSMIAKILAASGYYSILKEPITIWDIGRPFIGTADDCRSAGEATPRVVRRIRRALATAHAGAETERFVDDLPHHIFRLDFVRAVMPEARFIIVQRDPRNTLAAMKRGWLKQDTLAGVIRRKATRGRHRFHRFSRLPAATMRWTINYARRKLGRRKASWGPTAPGQRDFARTHTLVETIAYQWSQMAHYTLRAMEQLPSNYVVTVRYEDLFARRAIALQPVAAITALPVEVIIDAADRVIDNARDESDLLLPDSEWHKAERIIAPFQQAMGYHS